MSQSDCGSEGLGRRGSGSDHQRTFLLSQSGCGGEGLRPKRHGPDSDNKNLCGYFYEIYHLILLHCILLIFITRYFDR